LPESAQNSPVLTDTQRYLLNHLQEMAEPAPVGWWPPAPGWWVVAAIVLSIVIYVCSRLIQRIRGSDKSLLAIRQLQLHHRDWQTRGSTDEQSAVYLMHANRTLRQWAIALHGRTAVARLTGAQWTGYLVQVSGFKLSARSEHALLTDAWQTKSSAPVDSVHNELCELIRRARSIEMRKRFSGLTRYLASVTGLVFRPKVPVRPDAAIGERHA